jgi:hypothetical protein
LPVLHAWATSPEGKVVDNTLSDPEKALYMGVTYDSKEYMMHVLETEQYGVLGSESAGTVLAKGGI